MMRAGLAVALMLLPLTAHARSSSGAFWLILAIPVAIPIAVGFAALFGRRQIDLLSFVVGLFVATPIVTGIALVISQWLNELTRDIPTWVLWAIVLTPLVILGHYVQWRGKKNEDHSDTP